MLVLLLLATLTTLALSVQAADTLVKAKLHAWRNGNLCVGLADGTYNRATQLRPCSHESATWVIRDNGGRTFMRHENLCLNGGWITPDGAFDLRNGNDAYAHLCQDEGRRSGWDTWSDVSWPWRWFRQGDQFIISGYENTYLPPCLDVRDGKLRNGAPLQIWECHDSGHPDYDNQRFRIEWLGPEYPY